MRKNPLDIANDLITYFSKSYVLKMGKKPILNRGKMKYGLAEILQDWNQTEIKEFIDYYVKSTSDPDLTDFCRRYDEIISDKQIEENDTKERKRLMSETQRSVREFREKYKSAE